MEGLVDEITPIRAAPHNTHPKRIQVLSCAFSGRCSSRIVAQETAMNASRAVSRFSKATMFTICWSRKG